MVCVAGACRHNSQIILQFTVSQGFQAFLSQCRSMGRGRGGLPPPLPMTLTGTFNLVSAHALHAVLRFNVFISVQFSVRDCPSPPPPPQINLAFDNLALFRLNGVTHGQIIT